MQKPLVFISHINEEKEIAQALKRLVESTFLHMIEVFVSSDPTSIRMGRKWLDEITHALTHCSVEIILASPESVKRPWINFEAGSGWVRAIPVIPLCHSEMVPSKLPAPISSLQAATITDEAQLRLIFPVLADAVGCDLPQIDFAEFISVVKAFESTSRQINAMTDKSPVALTDGLSPHEIETLIEIAEQTAFSGEKVAVRFVKEALEKLGLRGIAVILSIQMLSRKDLLETSIEQTWGSDDYPVVMVSNEGWLWLEANKDKLVLTQEPKKASKPTHVNTPPDDVPF